MTEAQKEELIKRFQFTERMLKAAQEVHHEIIQGIVEELIQARQKAKVRQADIGKVTERTQTSVWQFEKRKVHLSPDWIEAYYHAIGRYARLKGGNGDSGRMSSLHTSGPPGSAVSGIRRKRSNADQGL